MSKKDYQLNDNPSTIDVDIFDGFHLQSNLRDPPTKYGHLALVLCYSESHEIHTIFDDHVTPSPRDVDIKKQRELYMTTSQLTLL